jgi:hypothetical protein
MDHEFSPSAEIRAFDGRKLQGLEVTITCQHTNDKNSDQYVSLEKIPGYDFLHASGWAGQVLGEKDEKLKRKIVSCYLMQATNGGRSDRRHYNTYWAYFNDERKDRWSGKEAMGVMGAVLGLSGDDHRADVVLEFEDFTLESSAWDFERPQEWYSEIHKDKPVFRFVDGFYENAEKAVNAFRQKNHDDIFGERYFPVLVFPVSTPRDKVNGIIWRPKVTSDPILVGDFVVYGTRCKPHEYQEVIEGTYEAGGKVPIGVEWSW